MTASQHEAGTTETPALEVSGLTRVLAGRKVLDGLDLTIDAGERVALVGESGSGKSTLLNLIAGLDDPDAGLVRIKGERMPASATDASALLRRRQLGFVFQAFHLLPHLNALRNVAVPLLLNGIALPDALRRAGDLLERVNLAGRGDALPGQLSGGEQQRVALARALSTGPALLLADEPTGNLDPASAAQALALIREECAVAGTALLLVTHSEAAARSTDRILRLTGGRLRAD